MPKQHPLTVLLESPTFGGTRTPVSGITVLQHINYDIKKHAGRVQVGIAFQRAPGALVSIIVIRIDIVIVIVIVVVIVIVIVILIVMVVLMIRRREHMVLAEYHQIQTWLLYIYLLFAI